MLASGEVVGHALGWTKSQVGANVPWSPLATRRSSVVWSGGEREDRPQPQGGSTLALESRVAAASWWGRGCRGSLGSRAVASGSSSVVLDNHCYRLITRVIYTPLS